MRIACALGMACALWTGVAIAQDQGTAAAEDAPPAGSEPAGPEATLSLTIEPTGDHHVGDAITLRLTVDAASGTRVRVPEQELADFELLQREALPVTTLPDGRERHEFTLQVMRFTAGEVELPALRVRAVAPDETVATLQTEPRKLTVLSRLANEPDAKPREATQPVVVTEEDYTLAWVAGGLLAALALAGAGFWYARYRARRPKASPPPPPARPPWELALEKLAALEGERESFLQEGRAAEYVDAISDVARAYLGRRYGFDGLESTTDEVVAALSAGRHPELPMTSVVTLLSDCDLVKFAKATPDEALCQDVHEQARKLVERSRPEAPTASVRGEEGARP